MCTHDTQGLPTERRDRTCSEFAKALKDGKSPSIEDCVGRLPKAERSELLAALVREEHCHFWQMGEPHTLVAYRARFPDHIEAVERACFTKPIAGGVRYTLLCALADGGQAQVYVAKDNERDTVVVVKVARDRTATAAKQFKKESDLLKKNNHPLVVPILDYFERAGRPFIVLEYVEGKTLAKKLRSEGPFAPSDAAQIVEQVADTVHYVHEGMAADGRPLIHRDLKPAHIILHQRDGKPRLLDFGMASYTESITGSKSSAHHGTLEYMSPEQATAFVHGNSNVDRRSDIWALGALLFELLTAQRPFGTRPSRESFASMQEWSDAIEEYLEPRTSEDSARVVLSTEVAMPELLLKIIERCVEKRPDNRYQTAGDVAHALRQWRNGAEGMANLGGGPETAQPGNG
jgi:eukaryotic-like serine/threonine-protein kinase